MARIYAGSLCHSPPSPILNCAPLLRTALLRTALINCCKRFSIAAIGASASSGAQAGQGQGGHADKWDSIALGGTRHGAAAEHVSCLICADDRTPGRNGSGESKCGDVEEAHGQIDKKD